MKKQLLILGGFLLVAILVVSVIFTRPKNEVVLDDVSLKDYTDNKDGMFAIMVEDDNGDYVEYTDSTSWPTGMVFNSEYSGCIDNEGNTIDDVLTFSNGTATVNTTKTSYCYLYFDNFECSEGSNFSQCLVSFASSNGGSDETLIEHTSDCDNGCAQDGKYRYSGASDDVSNYVCFGTNDLDACLADSDTYLFRIIEVDPNTGNVKLIRATELAGSSDYSSYSGSGDSYYWNGTDGTTSTIVMYGTYYNYWAVDDTLYATLATDLNTTYLNTFDTDWQNIIEDYNWNIGGADEKNTGYQVSESSWTSSNYIIAAYTNESAVTAKFKIGLVNFYDYGYAASSEFWTIPMYYYSSSTYGSPYESDWLNFESAYWTIARDSTGYNGAFNINMKNANYFGYPVYSISLLVYPSFYLTSNVTYLSGSGTSSSPYLLSWS